MPHLHSPVLTTKTHCLSFPGLKHRVWSQLAFGRNGSIKRRSDFDARTTQDHWAGCNGGRRLHWPRHGDDATIAGSGFGYTLPVGSPIFDWRHTGTPGNDGSFSDRRRPGPRRGTREKTRDTAWWLPTATLVIAAIFIGNAAYEAGNLSGATLGATLLIGAEFKVWTLLLLAALAFFLLSRGTPQLLERALITMVAVMGLVFVTTAVITKPPLLELVKGLVTPTLPENSLLMVAALIGTTVVPYNLFLHASMVESQIW